MKGIKSIAPTLIALGLAATAAQASETGPHVGPYIGAHLGAELFYSDHKPLKFDAGPIYGIQVGYSFGKPRTEVEFSYHETHGEDHETHEEPTIRMTDVIFNGFYDFDFGTPFVPFIGAGIGWIHAWYPHPYNNPDFTIIKNNEFAYQGIVGFDLKTGSNASIGFSYHYLRWGSNTGNEQFIMFNFNYFFS